MGFYVAVNIQYLVKSDVARTEYEICPNIHAEKIEKVVRDEDIIVKKDGESLTTTDIQESMAQVVPPIYKGKSLNFIKGSCCVSDAVTHYDLEWYHPGLVVGGVVPPLF